MKKIFKEIIVRALTLEARLVLKKYKPKIVAVTGSVGKTTTKDAVYYALASAFYVRRSEKSYNSEIGIPLTILGCQNAWYDPVGWLQNIFQGLLLILWRHPFPSLLVLEVGADRPGDIQTVSKWLKPDVVVFTHFAEVPVHVEFFENREEVLKEKSYLILNMKSEGHLIVNADQKEVLELQELHRSGPVTTYGITNTADLTASSIDVLYEGEGEYQKPVGISLTIDRGEKSIQTEIKGALGKQHVYPVLAGVAVAVGQGLSSDAIEEGLRGLIPPRGRMNIIEGIKKTTIIDDSYNSSPIAVQEALETLKLLKASGRKIAVLGDMMELGRHSAEAHQSIGRLLSGTVDILVTIGVRAREIAEVALQNGLSEKNVFQYEASLEAGAFLQNVIKEGDIILVKGSQSVRCEKVVEEIMAHPEKKAELLVRQEREWAAK